MALESGTIPEIAKAIRADCVRVQEGDGVSHQMGKTKVPRKSRLSPKGLVAKMARLLPRSGQDLDLGAIGGGRRRSPPTKHTPKGGLQKEEVEREPVQRRRDLDLLTI
eukprot:1220511-Prorocentrum_lima.AAC.1